MRRLFGEPKNGVYHIIILHPVTESPSWLISRLLGYLDTYLIVSNNEKRSYGTWIPHNNKSRYEDHRRINTAEIKIFDDAKMVLSNSQIDLSGTWIMFATENLTQDDFNILMTYDPVVFRCGKFKQIEYLLETSFLDALVPTLSRHARSFSYSIQDNRSHQKYQRVLDIIHQENNDPHLIFSMLDTTDLRHLFNKYFIPYVFIRRDESITEQLVKWSYANVNRLNVITDVIPPIKLVPYQHIHLLDSFTVPIYFSLVSSLMNSIIYFHIYVTGTNIHVETSDTQSYRQFSSELNHLQSTFDSYINNAPDISKLIS